MNRRRAGVYRCTGKWRRGIGTGKLGNRQGKQPEDPRAKAKTEISTKMRRKKTHAICNIATMLDNTNAYALGEGEGGRRSSVPWAMPGGELPMQQGRTST